MAEHRPYRPPRVSSGDLRRTKALAAASMALAFIATNFVATQHAAKALGYSPYLGSEFIRAPRIGLIYAPSAQAQAQNFQAEQVALQTLELKNQTAAGNLQAIQVSNEIALAQIQQIQLLRQLVMAEMNSQNVAAANQVNCKSWNMI